MERLCVEHYGKLDLFKQWKLKVIEYGKKIQRLEKELKERKQGIHALESVKEEASKANEELREEHRRLFTQLNVIQDTRMKPSTYLTVHKNRKCIWQNNLLTRDTWRDPWKYVQIH